MLSFDIRSSAPIVLAQLTKLQKEQLPEAGIRAANRTGREVVLALRNAMGEVFDRPTPWAQRGVLQTLASRSRPVFTVYLEESPNKGTPAADFLAAEIEGGERKHKRFEKALIAKGLMRAGAYAVPGNQAPRDAYGNVPGPFIVRMLSDLQAFGEQGYRANRRGPRTGKRKTNYFFVPPAGSRLKPGVYWHMPGGLIGVAFIFVSRTAYTARYDFYGIGRKVYDRLATRLLTEEVTRLTAAKTGAPF